MSRLGKTEKIIFSVALLMLLAFSYFLYDDSLLFPKAHNEKLELIGSVSLSQNDVRRKNLDNFSWLPASRKDSIYQNDSIFTGDGSEAQIQLQDGTIIRIQPNSLITLNMKNGQMTLDLRYGNLEGEIAQGSNLKIKSGVEEFNLEPSKSPEKSKIHFKKTHSGNVDLKLLAGKVNFVDRKAKKELVKDNVVAVSPKGEVKAIQKPTIELKTAPDISWTRINPDDPLPFEWIGHGDISKYEIEIAPSQDFVSLAVSKSTPQMNATVTEPLEPGAYFWRVKAYDPSGSLGAVSEFRKMSISHLGPPQITSPQKEAKFNLELPAKTPDDLVAVTEFKWQAAPILKSFTYQVAADQEFTKVLKEGSSTEYSALTPRLPSGTYWVRVAGQTAAQKTSPWSEAVPFTLNLIAKKEERPDRPVLITKEINFKLPRANERRPASEMSPQVAWKPVMNSKKYHVQVSKDMNFKNAERYDANDTKALLSQVSQPGDYYFRVYARHENGSLSLPSDLGTLHVDISPPLREALVMPRLLEPFNFASIFLQTEQEPFIWLEWKKVAGATQYTIEISDKEDFSAILLTASLDKNRFLLRNRMPLGKIYWRVRAESKESDFSPWAEKHEFTLYHQKNETFVK